jgi:MFS superfamily sulfate permease-like transporter
MTAGARSAGKAVVAFLHEIAAGFTVAAIALPLCIGAGVLAYGPFGPDLIAYAAVAGLTSAIVTGIVGALARRSSFVVTLPSTPIALIQASFAATLLDAFQGNATLAFAAVPFLAITVGLTQIVFGASGLSRLVKFAPYPVVAGFGTGIGLLIALAQLPKLFGYGTNAELLRAGWMAFDRPLMPIFGLLLSAAMIAVSRRAPRVPALLVGLIGGVAIFHLLKAIAPGLDLGPTLGTVSLTAFWAGLHFDSGALKALISNFAALQALLLTAATVALLCTLDIAFALRNVQNLADMPVSPRRDAIGQGIANLVGAVGGGLTVSASMALSNANFRAGGRTRLSSLTAALALAGVLLAPDAIALLPLIVLAAILLTVGLLLADRWVIQILREAWRADEQARRRRARRNLLIVLTVIVATVFGQPVVGAAVGVLLACLLFIIDMSQPVVRRRLRGDRMRSKRVRSVRDLEILAGGGSRSVVLELQGVLFFGNADDLASELRRYDDDSDIIVLDMQRVTSVDTSGATVLQQIAARCRARGKALLVCANHPAYLRLVEHAVDGRDTIVCPSLDAALEWAENRLIEKTAIGESFDTLNLSLEQTDLARDMSVDNLAVLSRHLAPAHYLAGDTLCRTGDAADRFWIIRRGSVSVRLAGAKSQIRLASLAPGCCVGEMGLLDNRPRSADAVADEEVQAYLLTKESFDTIMRDHPHIGQAILSNIARQLAQRLRHTSEDLRLAES